MTRTTKEKLLALVSRMPDDVSWDEVTQRLELLRHIEISRQQAALGQTTQEEFLKELLAGDPEVPPHPHFPSVT
jgi:hypothetical protein